MSRETAPGILGVVERVERQRQGFWVSSGESRDSASFWQLMQGKDFSKSWLAG